MNIVDYFSLDEEKRARCRARIGESEWRGARFLRQLLERDALREHCGEGTRLLLGLEGERLAALCTLADRDEIDAPDMTPWIGFVYTFPEFRGMRRSGELIAHACEIARRAGFERVYISTDEAGLYEKYGFGFLKPMKVVWGGDTRVYVKEL